MYNRQCMHVLYIIVTLQYASFVINSYYIVAIVKETTYGSIQVLEQMSLCRQYIH